MRERLLKKLPAMLDAAIAAYQRIALSDPPADDTKSASANHSGAKAILGHIDQIMKLAESTLSVTRTGETASNDLEAILAASRDALAGEEDRDTDKKEAGGAPDASA